MRFKLFEAFTNRLINEDKEYDELHTKAMDMSNKFTPEERARYKELSIEQYPIVIKKLPGDIYEIKTVGGGDTKLQGDLLAEYNREELLAKIKNPKGIHLDNRRNDGGQQPPFKAILDFFVETPEDKDGNRKIPIEQQTDYWPTDEWTDEDKERGYESKINYLESKIEDKNKFTNIPTIVSTSDWTFSGGEFLTDTLKNFGKENITHVGSNSGGGANRTSSTADDMAKTWPEEDPNAKGLKVEEKLERSLKVFEKFYIDKEQAKEVRESIMKDPSKYIKDGKINEKAVEDNMRKITKDFHVSYFTDDDGRIEVMAPYGKSDRIVTDKNGKPIGPPYEFKGNWEGTGTGNAVPGIGMTETDPDTAKNSALELLYTKTGQKDQLDKMKSNPEEFGLTKDGKDDWYTRGTLEDREAGKDVYYPGYAADGVHPKMWKESQHAAEENKKNWGTILKAADDGKNIDDKSKAEPENWWEEYSDEAKDAYIKKHGEAPDVGNKISLNTEKQTMMKHIKLFEQFMNEASSRINITGLDSKEIKGLKQWGDAKVAGPGVYFTFLDKDKEEILNYLNNIDSADFDKSLLEGIIEEGINDPGILKAFFMAGGPGSGKSYVASELFGFPKSATSSVSYATGLKLVNNDNAFERAIKDAGYDVSKLADYAKDPEVWSEVMTLRDKAKGLTRRMQNNYISGRLGQVIDGTGKNFDKLAGMRTMYKDLGYDTYMVFVNTSLDTALERNRMRDRKLDDKMVTKMWKAVQDNLGKFQKEFGSNDMIIVDNNATDGEEDILTQIEKQIMKRINDPIKNVLGKRWISDNSPQNRNKNQPYGVAESEIHVDEAVEPQIKKIAELTGVRVDAVEDYVSSRTLNITKLLKYLKAEKYKGAMDFVKANLGDKKQDAYFIKMFNESVVTESKNSKEIKELEKLLKSIKSNTPAAQGMVASIQDNIERLKNESVVTEAKVDFNDKRNMRWNIQAMSRELLIRNSQGDVSPGITIMIATEYENGQPSWWKLAKVTDDEIKFQESDLGKIPEWVKKKAYKEAKRYGFKKIKEVNEAFLNEAKLTKKDFDKVVKAVEKSKQPATVLLVPKFNEIEIIVGWDAPDSITDEIYPHLDKLKYGTNDVIIAGDSSNLSRREYDEIAKVNGGHKDY